MTDVLLWGQINAQVREVRGLLVVGDHLVEVLVDLGQLGGELLVLEGVALLVEDLGHGGDHQQPRLGLNLEEVVVVVVADGGLVEEQGLAGEEAGGARGHLASQDPGN